MSLSLEDAQRVVSKAFSDSSSSHVVSISEIETHEYFSYTRNNRTYLIDLSSSSSSVPPTHTSFITLTIQEQTSSPGQSSESAPYPPNSLQVFAHLIKLIQSQTSIPIAPPILDTTLSIIAYPYLLTPPQPIKSSEIISLARARSEGLLNQQQDAFVDLQLGQLLGQLHQGVQNDWYGRPSGDSASPSPQTDSSYSWQETFVSLLEPLLSLAESSPSSVPQLQAAEIPYEDLRRCLCRAIAFFLFDDVQVPSLIWFTGSSYDIYITRPAPSSESGSDLPTIAAILPDLAHALWGDPLLESFFLPSPPWKSGSCKLDEAMRAGYEGSGGEPLVVFPRQRTKRLWYSVFLALVVLFERGGEGEKSSSAGAGGDQKTWAVETLKQCSEALKDAPCF